MRAWHMRGRVTYFLVIPNGKNTGEVMEGRNQPRDWP